MTGAGDVRKMIWKSRTASGEVLNLPAGIMSLKAPHLWAYSQDFIDLGREKASDRAHIFRVNKEFFFFFHNIYFEALRVLWAIFLKEHKSNKKPNWKDNFQTIALQPLKQEWACEAFSSHSL